MGLSTHVLDTARGVPAAGVEVVVQQATEDGWTQVATAVTDDDGRAGDLAGSDPQAGPHRLVFAVGPWHEAAGIDAFWPSVTVTFEVVDPTGHLHVPLLLSPFGYSTYRGS